MFWSSVARQRTSFNPFRAPKSLPILTSSKFVKKKRFSSCKSVSRKHSILSNAHSQWFIESLCIFAVAGQVDLKCQELYLSCRVIRNGCDIVYQVLEPGKKSASEAVHSRGPPIRQYTYIRRYPDIRPYPVTGRYPDIRRSKLLGATGELALMSLNIIRWLPPIRRLYCSPATPSYWETPTAF